MAVGTVFFDGLAWAFYGSDLTAQNWSSSTYVGSGRYQYAYVTSIERVAPVRLGYSVASLSNYSSKLVKDLPVQLKTVFLGFTVYFSSDKWWQGTSNYQLAQVFGGQVWNYDEGGQECQLSLKITANGTLALYRGQWYSGGVLLGTGNIVIKPRMLVYIELRAYIDSVNGEYEVRVNGVTDISGTGANTKGSASYGYVESFGLYSAQRAVTYFTDVYVRGDPSGNASDGWWGPIMVEDLHPDSDGTHRDWDRSTGSSDYTLVDEVSVANSSGLTDYLFSSTAGDRLTLGQSNLSYGYDIKCVSHHVVVKGVGGNVRDIKFLCRSGGTTYAGDYESPFPLVPYESLYEVDPGTSLAWTESGVNAAEFGLEI